MHTVESNGRLWPLFWQHTAHTGPHNTTETGTGSSPHTQECVLCVLYCSTANHRLRALSQYHYTLDRVSPQILSCDWLCRNLGIHLNRWDCGRTVEGHLGPGGRGICRRCHPSHELPFESSASDDFQPGGTEATSSSSCGVCRSQRGHDIYIRFACWSLQPASHAHKHKSTHTHSLQKKQERHICKQTLKGEAFGWGS